MIAPEPSAALIASEAAPEVPSVASVLPCPEVWHEVAAERERAHLKHRETSMEQQPVDALLRLSILMEEVGEVARCFNEARHRGGFDSGDLTAMRQELIQVAAMAGAWAAALTPYAQADAVQEDDRPVDFVRFVDAPPDDIEEADRG